jgi:nitroreductase
MNPTLETIYNRHSVRLFTRDSVPDSTLRILLAAANQAPSAHNQQSWRFLVVRGGKKQALADLVSASAADFPRPASSLLRMAARSLTSAPVAVAVVNTGDLIRHGGELFPVDRELARDFFRTMEIQSSAAAVENLLLAATSLGLGTVWLGILFLIKDRVREFLGEDKGEFMAVVPLGYPQRRVKGPSKKPLEVLVRELE